MPRPSVLDLAGPDPVPVEVSSGGEVRTLRLRPVSVLDSASLGKLIGKSDGELDILAGGEIVDSVKIFCHQLGDEDRAWMCKQMGCDAAELPEALLAKCMADPEHGVLPLIIDAVNRCYSESYPDQLDEEMTEEGKKKLRMQVFLTGMRWLFAFAAGLATGWWIWSP